MKGMLIALALIAALLSACDTRQGSSYEWRLPPDFPQPAIPADNPMTLEKIELGRRLFYDKRLSANGAQSCASCHSQALAFSDGARTATGSTGERHRRNSMSLVNTAYSATYTWAHPGITTLEQHMLNPLFGERPIEMGAAGREREILARIESDATYRELFGRAFPWRWRAITFDNVVKSIACFVRTMNSFDSPFDRYAYFGEDAALTESQVRGMNLFMSERLECAHCHSGFNFSQFVTHESLQPAEKPFHVTGLYHPTRAGQELDRGLFDVTKADADKDRFKAPTLRNIELTAPYMHDGSLATLEEVIDFYAAGGRELTGGPNAGDGRRHPSKSPFIRGFTLTEQEREDVIGFLRSLTDRSFVIRPELSDPFVAP